MKSAILLILAALTSAEAISQETPASLSFAIYRVIVGERTLIAEGQRDYTSSDIEIVPWGRPVEGYQQLRKTLYLKDGFSIGTITHRTHESIGFGLWIQQQGPPEEFSWEWFSRLEGDVFRAWPEKERVRVTYREIPRGVEIQSVEFLTDVTLKFTNDRSLPPGVPTHEVLIYAGSVFRIAP
jgi:hypothetical protein